MVDQAAVDGGATVPQRTLTVACGSGLANRLRVLLSGLVLAEATERTFAMLWPRTPACTASFDELFTNTWNVGVDEAGTFARLPAVDILRKQQGAGWMERPDPHLAVQHVGWLFAGNPIRDQAEMTAKSAMHLAQLRPKPELERRIDEFASQNFRPTMIGVHLRRGDFVRRRPDVVANTTLALAQVDRFVERAPDAGILLCTDDGAVDQVTGAIREEGLHERFVQRYGDRVVRTWPRSLDRRTATAIQDAVVDLWLLRRTDFLVGSAHSSFSELAAFGRAVPVAMVSAGTPAYRRLAGFCRRSGVEALLRHAPLSDRFDAQTPFWMVWEFYTGLPGRAARRLLRRWAT